MYSQCMILAKILRNQKFSIEIFIHQSRKNLCILHGLVFVMVTGFVNFGSPFFVYSICVLWFMSILTTLKSCQDNAQPNRKVDVSS